MLSLFNASVADEVIGLSDFDLLTREQAARTYKDEQDVIRTKSPIINKVYLETLNDGVEHKIAVTILPLIDDKDGIIGVLGITKIITDL